MKRPALAALATLAVLLGGLGQAHAAPTFNTKELGVRMSSAAIQAATGAYPALRVYYIRGSTAVYSATTADGLTLVEEAGVRLSTETVPALDIAISSITGLSILPLDAGGFRMAYSVVGATGAYRIYTATSADGLAWANSTGSVVDAGSSTFAGHPSLVELTGGDWRMYFIKNVSSTTSFSGRQIYSALSTNEGRNFGAESSALATTAGHVAATKLTSGNIRLYYTAPPSVGVATNTQVLSAISTNLLGTTFAAETGVRLSTGTGLGEISYPFVARSTDSFRWRIYYDFRPFNVFASTADAWSATTDAPYVKLLNPSVVLRTATAQVFTIDGEVFSTAPTALLRKAGQPDIVGAGLTRLSDMSLQYTFNTENQSLGDWDLIVTNDDSAQSGTLVNALLIDFAGGDVKLTDNLLRPRQGGATRFDVTLFTDGQLSVRVYTVDGRLVATLYDGHATAGTTTMTWNGRTGDGGVAASGVYVVRAKGPKLDAYNKVVLIK